MLMLLLIMCAAETRTWSKPSTTGTGPSPRDKLASAAVGQNIYYFGGFGPKTTPVRICTVVFFCIFYVILVIIVSMLLILIILIKHNSSNSSGIVYTALVITHVAVDLADLPVSNTNPLINLLLNSAIIHIH